MTLWYACVITVISNKKYNKVNLVTSKKWDIDKHRFYGNCHLTHTLHKHLQGSLLPHTHNIGQCLALPRACLNSRKKKLRALVFHLQWIKIGLRSEIQVRRVGGRDCRSLYRPTFTLSLSIASSPPGVDMMRSWMLVTDWRPTWLHSEPEDGEAVREPIGAVEKWPGRWFSEAIKYLCLLFWMSLRSEPTAGKREREKEHNVERGGIGPGQDRGNKPHKMKEPNAK